ARLQRCRARAAAWWRIVIDRDVDWPGGGAQEPGRLRPDRPGADLTGWQVPGRPGQLAGDLLRQPGPPGCGVQWPYLPGTGLRSARGVPGLLERSRRQALPGDLPGHWPGVPG